MKKTILALLMAISSPVLAQTEVIPPSQPIITPTSIVSPNAAAALAVSTANQVFIDQSGDNPNVNIIQDGSGNKQGSENRPIYLRGIDQVIVSKQVGTNNEINLEIVNDNTGDPKGASVTIQQLGNSNKVDAACGYGLASAENTSLIGCNNADLNWKFTGNSNELQFRGTGNLLSSAVTVSGDLNKFYIDSISDNHSQTLIVSGDSNEFNINQRSTGISGSSVWVDLSGTSNKINISQTGSIDSVVNLKSVSNNGIFNINQKN